MSTNRMDGTPSASPSQKTFNTSNIVIGAGDNVLNFDTTHGIVTSNYEFMNKRYEKRTSLNQNKTNKIHTIGSKEKVIIKFIRNSFCHVQYNTLFFFVLIKMLNMHGNNAKQLVYPSTSSPSSLPSPSPSPSLQKLNISRNVQVLSKGFTGNSSSMSQVVRSNAAATQNHQTTTQCFENVSTENVGSSLKTIYINNNNNGNLNMNRTNYNKNISTPVEYSERGHQKGNRSISSPINADERVKYSFNFQPTPTPASSQTGVFQQTIQVGGSNSIKATKLYNDTQNIKPISSSSSFYYQPHVYSEAGNLRFKGINNNKNQPQQLQVTHQHQRSSVTAGVGAGTPQQQQSMIPGKAFQVRNNATTSKYAVQRSLSPAPHHVQQIRYTCGPGKNEGQFLYNDVVNLNSNQSSVLQSPLKVRTLVHHIEATALSHDDAYATAPHIYTVAETQPSQDSIESTNSGIGENYMIVNGTKITEEMSARILHDLSQRNSKFQGSNNSRTDTMSYQHSTTSHQYNRRPEHTEESTWASNHNSLVNLDGFNNKHRSVEQSYQATSLPVYASYRNMNTSHAGHFHSIDR